MQAPLGYDNPAGDPGTLGGVYSTDDYSGLALSPYYIQLAMTTDGAGGISGGIISWGADGGDVRIDNLYNAQTPKFDNTSMYDPDTDQQDIVINKAGVWFFALKASVYPDTDFDRAEIRATVLLYDTDGTSLLKSSGSHPIEFYASSESDTFNYDFFAAGASTALFEIQENQIIKCAAHFNEGTVYASVVGWRLGPLES